MKFNNSFFKKGKEFLNYSEKGKVLSNKTTRVVTRVLYL